MTPFVLTWLLPGYILHLFHKAVRPYRNSSGWDFVALNGIYSAVFYVICHLLAPGLAYLPWVKDALDSLRLLLDLPEECSLVPLAVGLAALWGYAITRREFYHNWVWSISRPDPYTYFLRAAVKNVDHVIISLKSNKVYVGPLKHVTLDPNEPFRTLLIITELSGYRNKDTHQVVFDKNYGSINHMSLLERLPNYTLIPYSEITTMAKFSFQLHQKYVEAGITKLGGPPESEDASGA